MWRHWDQIPLWLGAYACLSLFLCDPAGWVATLCDAEDEFVIHLLTQPISESKSVDQHVNVTLSSDCNSISVFVWLFNAVHEGKSCSCVKSCHCNAYCSVGQWFLNSVLPSMSLCYKNFWVCMERLSLALCSSHPSKPLMETIFWLREKQHPNYATYSL